MMEMNVTPLLSGLGGYALQFSVDGFLGDW